jgi:peptidoglycan/xylan/chitin deacetylase (PgdA/CDA1 family)
MKYFLLILAILLTALTYGSSGLDRDVKVEIARWQGNASGAVTLSFDDGYLETYESAIPILEEKEVKATFNVITGRVGGNYGRLPLADWEHWEDVAERGHEIASHMATHAHVDEISVKILVEELESSKIKIIENTGMDAASFVYPGGAYDRSSRDTVANHFLSARTSDEGFNNFASLDLHLLKSNNAAEYNLPLMKSWSDEAMVSGTWLIENYHLVAEENPTGYSFFISIQDFERHLDCLKSKNLWIAPQVNVAKYIVERESSNVSFPFSSLRGGWIVLNHYNDLDPNTFDEPLTLIVRLPQGWNSLYVVQGGEAIEPRISEGVLYLDAVPNSGKIVITKYRFISYLVGLIRF